jgi:hypothetical protein
MPARMAANKMSVAMTATQRVAPDATPSKTTEVVAAVAASEERLTCRLTASPRARQARGCVICGFKITLV